MNGKITTGVLPLLMLFALNSAQGQQASTYWYNQFGEQQTVYFQSDVFAFRISNDSTLSDSLYYYPPVKNIYTRFDEPDGLTILEFNSGYSDSTYEEIRNTIRQQPGFICDFDVVNKHFGKTNEFPSWSPIDEEVLVIFHDPALSDIEVADFATRHKLSLRQAPLAGLPENHSHCYRFYIEEPYLCETGNSSIEICQRIWAQDSSLVYLAEPNLVMAFRPTTNDPKFALQWYVRNIGQPLADNSPPGSTDSDHDFDLVWSQGTRGNGIRVAVVDFDGFDLQHNDMNGAFIRPWSAISNSNLIFGNHIGNTRAHGMCVSGLIGARSDNGIGITGCAPECGIVPIEINSSTGAIVTGIQRSMLDYNVDSLMNHVLNLSMGTGYDFGSIHHELTVASKEGRNGYGMIIVASAGNYDRDTVLYPAFYDECISVGGSNPVDMRKTVSDLWSGFGAPWGSTFNSRVDVVAGSCLMPSTDHSGQWGYSQTPDSLGNYTIFDGTSAAAPVVSAACALILERYPNLIDTVGGIRQVRDFVRAGAEKVNTSVYDYNAFSLEPGRSLEMGYGRLNVNRSLLLVGNSEPSQVVYESFAISASEGSGEALLHYDLSRSKEMRYWAVYDVCGRMLLKDTLPNSLGTERIYLNSLPDGIYLIRIESAVHVSRAKRFIYHSN